MIIDASYVGHLSISLDLINKNNFIFVSVLHFHIMGELCELSVIISLYKGL